MSPLTVRTRQVDLAQFSPKKREYLADVAKTFGTSAERHVEAALLDGHAAAHERRFSLLLTDYSQVDMLGLSYAFVTFGVGKSPGAPYR